jgi:hypothetical protein
MADAPLRPAPRKQRRLVRVASGTRNTGTNSGVFDEPSE